MLYSYIHLLSFPRPMLCTCCPLLGSLWKTMVKVVHRTFKNRIVYFDHHVKTLPPTLGYPSALNKRTVWHVPS